LGATFRPVVDLPVLPLPGARPSDKSATVNPFSLPYFFQWDWCSQNRKYILSIRWTLNL
jgi:hypothetical protein